MLGCGVKAQVLSKVLDDLFFFWVGEQCERATNTTAIITTTILRNVRLAFFGAVLPSTFLDIQRESLWMALIHSHLKS